MIRDIKLPQFCNCDKCKDEREGREAMKNAMADIVKWFRENEPKKYKEIVADTTYY